MLAILRAVVGMVPRGGSDINPAVNAVQSLVCKKLEKPGRLHCFKILQPLFMVDQSFNAANKTICARRLEV